MSSNLIAGSHTFTFVSEDERYDAEKKALAAFLACIAKVEKTAAPIFMNLSSCMSAEDACFNSFKQAIESITGFPQTAFDQYQPMQTYLPTCSGTQTIRRTDNIYDASLDIVNKLNNQLAKDQLTQINTYMNSYPETSDSIYEILQAWESNWLTPIQDVKLFSMGPATRKVTTQCSDYWLTQFSTTLTLFTFKSALGMSAPDIFKGHALEEEVIIDYRTIEYSSQPVMIFSDWGEPDGYIEQVKWLFKCDPDQEIKSAPMA